MKDDTQQSKLKGSWSNRGEHSCASIFIIIDPVHFMYNNMEDLKRKARITISAFWNVRKYSYAWNVWHGLLL
jgi:hypothetical protein